MEWEMKTVNFIEAVNSGRRMKTDMIDLVNYRFESAFREPWKMLKEISECNHIDAIGRIINAQFELEEKSITITESEFDMAYDKYRTKPLLRDNLKKELGF